MTYFFRFKGGAHRVHTEWLRPLSDLHSIKMNKLAPAGDGEGCTPPPLSTRTKLHVYAPVERADSLPLFHLYHYVVCGEAYSDVFDIKVTLFL
jgi:hypothetical protein